MRDSFLFKRNYFEAIASLNAKQREHLFFAICDYALNETEPELTGVEQVVFDLIRPQLCANNQRYKNGKKGAEYGSKGGAPKGNQNARKNNPETTPKQPQNNPYALDLGLNKTTPMGLIKERETEKEREKEAEKEKNQKKIDQEKELEKDKEIEIYNTPRTREGDDFLALSASEQTESRKRFFDTFDIQIDSYSARLGDMDFNKLYSAYLESGNYLQVTQQCLFLSWICKNYTRIIGGYYKDKTAKPQRKSITEEHAELAAWAAEQDRLEEERLKGGEQ